MNKTKNSGRIGRPRSFDTEEALDRAIHVFLRKGYEGASLSDLTEAMGINRPSLYAAFGDKEALFRAALDRYSRGPGSMLSEALSLPTARQVAKAIFDGVIEAQSMPNSPRGCLIIQETLTCDGKTNPFAKQLVEYRRGTIKALADRFKRAKHEGDLPADAEPGNLARFVFTVTQGLAVQAAAGASRAELKRIAKTALRGWPT